MTTQVYFLLIHQNRLGSITTTCKLFRFDGEGSNSLSLWRFQSHNCACLPANAYHMSSPFQTIKLQVSVFISANYAWQGLKQCNEYLMPSDKGKTVYRESGAATLFCFLRLPLWINPVFLKKMTRVIWTSQNNSMFKFSTDAKSMASVASISHIRPVLVCSLTRNL